MPNDSGTPPQYMVSIYDDPAVTGALRFTFVAPRSRQNPMPYEASPQYILSVQTVDGAVAISWIRPPTDNTTRSALEEVARDRINIRTEWLQRLTELVGTVARWANELDWATRVVEKKLEDRVIGNYKAPALLLQNEAVRLFLEPIARVAPGTEGSVDLYLMPSYDDIASLYFYNDRWNVHYVFEHSPVVSTIGDAEARPLTKETLQEVFEEMRAHAG